MAVVAASSGSGRAGSPGPSLFAALCGASPRRPTGRDRIIRPAPQRRPVGDPPMTAITAASRLARLRNLAVTGLVTTGAAAAALTLTPATAHAAQAPTAASAIASRTAGPAGAKGGANNLDGWIKQSLAIMKAKGIPGTYEGLHRNIMRESSGNPNAQNNYDVNAKNGIPSKGLLQVIDPTFKAFHVAGTANSSTDPVANITAAANYAAHRYGSIDNVNSAY
ncbi:transglycosylase SLT domain-containing protein [Streptomyces sp. NPDC046870]|uniref:transglycosylase SLT domain-containing protein n=1 Tax=Streptomyces sp. NPDC046870 TaxID=3155135 RepID=UPI003452DBB3